MTAKEINRKARTLFNRWVKDFRNFKGTPNEDFYKRQNAFKNECLQLHNVVGAYDVLTDKNALKMASICSSLPFVEPFRMLMKLQHTTKTY